MKRLKTLFAFTISALWLCGCSGSSSMGVDLSSPLLNAIEVTGVSHELNPVFDPNIRNYSIIADEQSTGFSMSASSDDANNTISVNGELVLEGLTIILSDIEHGEKVDVTVSDSGGNENRYEIIYLPPDFPDVRTTLLSSGTSDKPLYMDFFNPLTELSYVVVMDNNGVPVFYIRQANGLLFDFKFHPETGERSFSRHIVGPRNVWGRREYVQVILDENNELVETITTTGLSHTDNHDFHILPNNELLLLSYDGLERDLSIFGLENYVEESVVQIIDRVSRDVIFEWRSLHEIPFEDQLYDPLRNEYAHINSAVIDNDGNILASLRGTSQVIKIDRGTGRLLWSFGGKSNQFEISGDPYTGACGQHDVSRLSNGNILIFDNGQQCLTSDNRGQLTRISEYKLDEVNLTAELVWSYSQEENYTVALGSAQRLENGNTLIGWGRGPDMLVTEIDDNNARLFELRLNSGVFLNYRTRRFDR